MHRNEVQGLLSFEWIQTPAEFRFSCLWRLVIFDDDAVESVGILGEISTQSEIRFLFRFCFFFRFDLIGF